MTKDWVHGVGHSPVCQILLQIVVRAVITSSPPAWTSSAGMFSTPADFPFFSDCSSIVTRRQQGSPLAENFPSLQLYCMILVLKERERERERERLCVHGLVCLCDIHEN